MKKKYDNAGRGYMKVMNVILVICGIIPVLVAIGVYLYTGNRDMFIREFIYWFSIMIALFVIIAVAYFMHEVFNLYRDQKSKIKVVESCIITEKKYVPVNNSYHFILNSDSRYSIEISAAEYERFETGDELNIEYARYTKEFFGYY